MKKTMLLTAMTALLFVSCDKKDDTPEKNNGKDNDPKPETEVKGITIDGDFSDWEALGRKGTVWSVNDPDSPWEAVDEIRVCADEENIYYYVLFNRDVIADYLAENDKLPCRINLNTDNEFSSGYSSYFLRAYDFIIEGELGDGNGGWSFYDCNMYQRLYDASEDKDKWVELVPKGSGLAEGAGSGVEYEIALSIEEFNAGARKSTDPKPIGDIIQTSMRFYETMTNPHWAELSNMPNESGSYGDLLDLEL